MKKSKPSLTSSDIDLIKSKVVPAIVNQLNKTLGSKIDIIENTVRIISENEQNLKDLAGLKRRLDVLDKTFTAIDKIAGEVTTYREQQELNSNKLSDHNDRIEKVETKLGIPPTI